MIIKCRFQYAIFEDTGEGIASTTLHKVIDIDPEAWASDPDAAVEDIIIDVQAIVSDEFPNHASDLVDGKSLTSEIEYP